MVQAAENLGISLRTLQRVCRHHGIKGRVLPIGAFVPAGLIPDPPSPGLTPSGVSRASQADPSRGPAPTIIEKKRARAAFTGGGGAAASPLYGTESSLSQL